MLTWQAGNKHGRFEDVSGYLKLEFKRCDAVWYIYLHGNRQNSWRNPPNMGKSSKFPLGKFATQPGVTSRCLGFACLKNRIFWVIGLVQKGHTCWILTHTIIYGIFTCMDGWFYRKCRYIYHTWMLSHYGLGRQYWKLGGSFYKNHQTWRVDARQFECVHCGLNKGE